MAVTASDGAPAAFVFDASAPLAAQLIRFVAALEKWGRVAIVPEPAARELAPLLEREVRRANARGTSPRPIAGAVIDGIGLVSRSERPIAGAVFDNGGGPGAPSEWLSVQNAATELGIDPTTVRRLCNRGELPSARVGGVRVIARRDVERRLQSEPGAVNGGQGS